MDAEGKKIQVSYEQLTALLEFLKEHEDLAKGLSRGRRRRGKFHTIKVWNLCAKKLNAIPDGATKDGKGWSKYWCDWKYRVRRRALELRASEEGNRPVPEGILPLSPMEETILSIIGETSVDYIFLNDPLSEVDMDEPIQKNSEDSSVTMSFDQSDPASPKGSKRRRLSMDLAGPSSPPEQKPSLDATNSGDFECSSSIATRASKRLKTQQSSDLDEDVDESINPPENKPDDVAVNNINNMEPDGEDKAAVFLSLEREKICGNKKIVRSLESIQSEITRLASVMVEIKDCLSTQCRRLSIN